MGSMHRTTLGECNCPLTTGLCEKKEKKNQQYGKGQNPSSNIDGKKVIGKTSVNAYKRMGLEKKKKWGTKGRKFTTFGQGVHLRVKPTFCSPGTGKCGGDRNTFLLLPGREGGIGMHEKLAQ